MADNGMTEEEIRTRNGQWAKRQEIAQVLRRATVAMQENYALSINAQLDQLFSETRSIAERED